MHIDTSIDTSIADRDMQSACSARDTKVGITTGRYVRQVGHHLPTGLMCLNELALRSGVSHRLCSQREGNTQRRVFVRSCICECVGACTCMRGVGGIAGTRVGDEGRHGCMWGVGSGLMRRSNLGLQPHVALLTWQF